jgi:hypothetical protein
MSFARITGPLAIAAGSTALAAGVAVTGYGRRQRVAHGARIAFGRGFHHRSMSLFVINADGSRA